MKKLSLILAVLAAAFIFAACAKPNKAESVNLEPEPAKKAYLYGEELDLGGGALNIVYTKGNVRTLEITPAMVTGYDKYAPGEQTLTVKASEKFKCTYTVTVAAPDSSYVVPTGITAVYGQTLKDIAAQLPQYFSWVTPSAPVGNAGSNTVYANYKPTAPGTEATANIAVVITVSKADPAITQAPSVPGSVFTYGDIPVLSGGVASVPGAFAWKNPNPVLFAGANDLEWVFTPADAANYNTVERSLNLTAGKAAPTVTDGNKPSADGAQFTYGQAMPAIKQGKALGLLGGEISGAFSWVNPPLTLAVNENIINWIFTPSGVDAANYTSASGAVTVTAGKAAPNIVTEPTVTPGAYTYGQSFPTVADGAAKGVDGNTLTGRFEYNGNGGTLLTGDNEIGWTFVPNDTANYGTASGTVTVTADKAAPSITQTPAVTPGAYTYGQSFPTVADGAAKGADGNTLAGRFEYNGNGGTLLTGDNEIGWTFVPNDTANYGTASGTVTVTAGKAAPNIVTEPTVTEASRFAGNVPVIEGGTAEGAFGEPLSGAFRWANLYTLVDGSNTLYWVFTPDDAVNYVEATGNIEVTVAGEPAPIELDFPSGTYIEDYESITALDPLSSVKIAGTVAEKISGTVVPGEFIWEDKDKLLQYGINACAWEFVPDVDADKYAELTGQCQINVTKKRKLDILPLTSSLGQLGNLYAGTELSTIALDTGLILDVQSGLLSGYDFMLEWATEVPRLKVGSYAYGINFTPFSGAGDNYEAGSYTATVEAQINKLNPPNESELYSGPDIDGRINLKTDPSSLMTETGAPVPNGRIEWAQGGGEHQLESGMPNIFEWRFVFEDPDMAQYYEECFGAISVYY